MSRSSHRESAADRILRLGPPVLLGAAPLVFLPGAGEFENIPKTAFLQWGIALLVLLHLARTVRGEVATGKRRTLDPPVIAFYLACWLPLPWAIDALQARAALLHWGGGVALYFLLARTLRGPDAVPRFFVAASVGGAVVCAIGILQHLTGLDWIPQSAPPASTFANRNMASHFVAICFPLALGTTVVATRRGLKAVGAASLLLSLVYLAFTRTHAAWLAVLVVIVASALAIPALRSGGEARSSSGKRWRVAAIALLILASAIGVWTTADRLHGDEDLLPRLASLARTDTGTAGLRWIFWQNTLAMVGDSPWLGAGLGNFKLHYPLYHRSAVVDWTFDEEHQLERVHNDHLQMLAELGVVGFAAWAWIFVASFRAVRMCWRERRGWVATQAFVVGMGLVAFLVVACFSFPMERAIPPAWLFALLGMLAALSARGERTRRTGTVYAWASVALVLAFLVLSVVFVRKDFLTNERHVDGLRWVRAAEHQRALTAFEAARETSPRDSDVLLRVASSYIAPEQYDRALEVLADVRRFHPHKVNAVSSQAYCHLRLGDHARAEALYVEALELLPDSPDLHTHLGSAHLGQQQIDPAIASYRKAIELADSSPFLPSVRSEVRWLQPRLLLAATLVTRGDLEAAMVEYEEILRRKPDLPEVRRVLDELRRRVGKAGMTEKPAP